MRGAFKTQYSKELSEQMVYTSPYFKQKSKLLLCWCINIFMFLGLNVAASAQDISPQRIVSLGPALTEQLFLLGVEDRLIANTIFCNRPPEAKKKEKIGTVIRANIEKIVSLKPDLVLATSLTHPEQKEKLRNLGIKVVGFPRARNFSQICEQFLELARLVGAEKEAVEIVNETKGRVNSIRKKVKDLANTLTGTRKRVFLQIGANPLFTVTKDCFINDLIESAGGINIASGARTGLYSREKVLKSNPEVIIIATTGIVGEEEKKIWQRFEALEAVKNNRVHIVNADKICRPTPVAFVEGLEKVAGILHPGLEID
ncbi:ABC transporter substrate-binding protein [candidate division NPL-UPA2 bacterium]|nr:ABC transporter substrate-binding protein [candidate division NPL-UPA2 bacterium]